MYFSDRQLIRKFTVFVSAAVPISLVSVGAESSDFTKNVAA